MSNNESVDVWCTILEERDLALKIEQQQARNNIIVIWIPRSQLDHISKWNKQPMQSKISMPIWLAEAKALDYQ